MLVLSRPPLNDTKALARLGRDPRFKSHVSVWTQAYADYEAAGGDPWIVSPAVFTEDIAEAQRALYETRRKTSAFQRMRRRADFKCCPMCGSGGRGHLDHLLPRAVFPEYSIFGANLVPACASCNSSNKGATYRGNAPERFLHPYFDTIAVDAIWYVQISGDLRAAQFMPKPMAGLDLDDSRRVAFHLKHVLGWDFEIWVANSWADIPQLVRDAREEAHAISGQEARRDLKLLYRQALGTQGRNGWSAALYRGVLEHPKACEYIAAQAVQRRATTV